MTYQGPFPGAPGYNAQHGQHQWVQQQQSPAPNSLPMEAYGNLQYQPQTQQQQRLPPSASYPQYHDPLFAPTAFASSHQPQSPFFQQQQQQLPARTYQQFQQQFPQAQQHLHGQQQVASSSYGSMATAATHDYSRTDYLPTFDPRTQSQQRQVPAFHTGFENMGQMASSPAQPVRKTSSPAQHLPITSLHPHQQAAQPGMVGSNWHEPLYPQKLEGLEQLGSRQSDTSWLQESSTLAQQKTFAQHGQPSLGHPRSAVPIQAIHNEPKRVRSPQIDTSVASQSPRMHSQLIPGRAVSGGARIEKSGRISASPRMSAQGLHRSPSVGSVRSPVPAPGLVPHHQDTNALLICAGEEMIDKARKGLLHVADFLDQKVVAEYQKLIATGLACLETVLSRNHRLPPRVEAKLQLRYASVLCEETTNTMEAETALTKGITHCEKYRFADLKYLMQFLQLKMLSQRKGKAALIAIDSRIKDAELLKHTQWVYALRFFKASLYLQSQNPSDLHAIDNLKAITTLALARGDTVVYAMASLLEGLSILKNMKEDGVVRIQSCIAQARKYQLDSSTNLPQLAVLSQILDLACSFHQKSPQTIAQQLQALHNLMDASIEDKSWSYGETVIMLPIKRQTVTLQVISDDTAAILKPGHSSEHSDYLAMSFWSKVEAFAMTHAFSGLGALHQTPRNDKRMFDHWNEALSQLDTTKVRIDPVSLQDARKDAEWRREFQCYVEILRGLQLSSHCQWHDVQTCLEKLARIQQEHHVQGVVGLFIIYLSGVYKQGTGDIQGAMEVFSRPILALDGHGGPQDLGMPGEDEVRLLAALNRIWIMHHPDLRDETLINDQLDMVRPLCSDHPNPEIRTAWNILMAASQTDPAMSMTSRKDYIQKALTGAKTLGDVQTLCIALVLMRAKLFQDVIGAQALKSARAGAAQAQRSGNLLWQSVAEGLLAQSYEVQGQDAEAKSSWDAAVDFAREAFELDSTKSGADE